MDMEDPAWVAQLVLWPYFVPHARDFEGRPQRAGGNGDPAFAGHALACIFYGWFLRRRNEN